MVHPEKMSDFMKRRYNKFPPARKRDYDKAREYLYAGDENSVYLVETMDKIQSQRELNKMIYLIDSINHALFYA